MIKHSSLQMAQARASDRRAREKALRKKIFWRNFIHEMTEPETMFLALCASFVGYLAISLALSV